MDKQRKLNSELYDISILLPQALARAVKQKSRVLLSGEAGGFRYGLWVGVTPRHFLLQRGFRAYCIEIFAATAAEGQDFISALAQFVYKLRKVTNLAIYYHCTLPSIEVALMRNGWKMIPQPKNDFTVLRLAPPVDDYALVRMGDKLLDILCTTDCRRRAVGMGVR